MGGRCLQKQWLPPDPGWLKINVDGAFLPATSNAAVGVIIRDHEGQVRMSAWRSLQHCRDAEEAEAMACCKGITLAVRWSDIPMVLETDCATIADGLKNHSLDHSINWSILSALRLRMEEFQSVNIVKISRSQNNVAHQLAHFAIRSGRSEVFFSSFPEFVVSLACNDTT